jgi:hypothetical protein
MMEKWERLKKTRQAFMWLTIGALALRVFIMVSLVNSRGSNTGLLNMVTLVDLAQLVSIPGWIIAGILERRERLKLQQARP